MEDRGQTDSSHGDMILRLLSPIIEVFPFTIVASKL